MKHQTLSDYRGNAPYTYFTEYKTKYARGYRGQAQKTIGERPGKGNSKAKILSKGNSNKEVSQGNNNMKKDHGGGNGKKK